MIVLKFKLKKMIIISPMITTCAAVCTSRGQQFCNETASEDQGEKCEFNNS